MTQGAVEPPASQDEGILVYITNTGKNYHRAACKWLSKRAIPISLEEAKRKRYTACATCKPPE